MRLRTPIFALALCTLAGLEPAAAQNLLTNSSFNNNITGWTKSVLANHTIDWAPRDERGSPHSGSLAVRNLPANLIVHVFSECLAVTAGETLTYGAAITAENASGGQARVGARFYSDPTCSGASTTFAPLLSTSFPVANWGASQGTIEVPAGAIRVTFSLTINGGHTPPSTVYFDNVFAFKDVSCVGTETVTCLNQDRFRVSATWQKPDGTLGWARVVELTDDSSYLWFFQPTNIEAVVKVLNACSFSPNFWVFAAGLTNVKVDVEIFDTLTGESWSHNNPQGQAFAPVQDTGAFATCAL